MPPHRNQLEARSSKAPARQFVSETHDHKPDAPSNGARFAPLSIPADTGPCIDRLPDHFAAVGPAVEQIIADVEKMAGEFDTLRAKARDLSGSSDHRQIVSLQLAATDVATTARQIESLATHVADKTAQRIDMDSQP